MRRSVCFIAQDAQERKAVMGRYLLSAFVMLLLVVSPMLAAAPVAAAASLPRIYLALGDSLAYGVGATDPARHGYVPRFYDYLRAPAHGGVDQLRNTAVQFSETSTSLITSGQLDQAVGIVRDEQTDVHVVTLDIGGNDLLGLLYDHSSGCPLSPPSPTCQQKIGAALLQFGQNYPLILAILKAELAADPGTETLLVMTYYNPFSGTGSPLEPLVEGIVQQVNSIITATATLGPAVPGVTVTVVDVYPLFVGKAADLTHIGEGTLDIHPTNAGYAVMTTAFRKVYRPSA
jgi:acyl-CoA thioesterase I